MYLFHSPLYLGVAIAILPLAGAQIIIGSVRFIRSFSEYRSSLEWLQSSDAVLARHELPRMQRRQLKFYAARKAELFVLVASFVGTVVTALVPDCRFLLGSVLVLLIQSAVMLAFDLINQFRVKEYAHHLNKVTKIGT